VEFLIDLSGRSRAVGKRDVAIAVSKVGYVHLRTVDRADTQRTAIVNFQPRLVSERALAALGYKLANLDPDRTVVVSEFPSPGCWTFRGYMPALKMVGRLVSGAEDIADFSSAGTLQLPM
jgi:hypothetical protein